MYSLTSPVTSSKTGVAGSATLKVGTEQNLDHIEMVGFLKKGKTEILDRLPADFKTSEYYLLFHAMDQNDCPIEAEDVTNQDVTFVSSDPLVVKELTNFAVGGLTVKGTEYSAVFVEPGINVAEGGEVTVSAIANKTGTKTDLNFIVGEDPVVVTFNISAPSGVVADGDTGVVIPFEAIDDKGNALTNFRALAKQEIFNTLSFTTSEGALTLAEQNDGTAKLTWSDDEKYQYDAEDPTAAWAESVTTDDVDRPVSLTVVVVGGEPDNEMLYVSDKRRPNAIANVDLSSVYVEGDELELSTDSFSYYDQYGKLIDYDADGKPEGEDNGFFAAAAAGVLKNIDFKDYSFGVRIENAGTGYVVYDDDEGDTYLSGAWNNDPDPVWTADADPKKAVVTSGSSITYATTTNILSAAPGEGFKFDIAKFKAANGITINNPADWESVSPTKFHGLTVVDITQVKSFKISDLNTFYTGVLDITGDKIIAADELENLKDSTYEGLAKAEGTGGIQEAGDYRQEIVVKGTYNSSSVTIPHDYYKVSTTKGSLVDSDDDDEDAFDKVGEIKLTDLYDRTTANGNAKLGQDEVVATIEKVHDAYGWWAYDEDLGLYVDEASTQEEATATLTNENKTAGALAVANAILDPDIAEGDLGNYENDTQAAALNNAKNDLALAKEALTVAQTDANEAAAALAEVSKGDAVTATAINTIIADETLGADSDDAAITAAVNDYDGAVLTDAQKANAKAYLTLYVADLAAKADLEEAEANVEAAQEDVDEATTKAAAETAVNDFEDKFDAAIAANNAGTKSSGNGGTYDTAKLAITYSDQAPYAADITGLKDSYIFNPELTVLNAWRGDFYDATQKKGIGDLEIVDQYGVEYEGGVLELTISNAVENEDGYAENNFKVSDNGTAEPSIVGAELGDTFDLVISVQGETLKKTTKVTVGADENASIVNSTNYYTNGDNWTQALKDVLEAQRKAGLQ